jgi:hypothetical protein
MFGETTLFSPKAGETLSIFGKMALVPPNYARVSPIRDPIRETIR